MVQKGLQIIREVNANAKLRLRRTSAEADVTINYRFPHLKEDILKVAMQKKPDTALHFVLQQNDFICKFTF